MARFGRIGSEGQVTLPKELMDRHHLHDGEVVIFLDSVDGILLQRQKKALRGAFRGLVDLEGFEAELARLRKEWTF